MEMRSILFGQGLISLSSKKFKNQNMPPLKTTKSENNVAKS